MATLYDARGNEILGPLDQITNGSVTDARTITALLSSVNAEVTMDLNGQASAAFDIRTAAASLTLVFEGTVDNVNYIGLPAFQITSEAYIAALILTTTNAQTYLVDCAGFRRVRCRVSAFTSGSVTIAARASVADSVLYAKPMPSQLHVTATAAVNTASTATLPAAGAGLFHYITRIQLVKLYSVIGVAAAAGTIITTTNLPGGPSYTTEQNATAAGATVQVIDENYCGNPLKSLAANTNTTFVAPAQLQTIWRWNVSYYVGA